MDDLDADYDGPEIALLSRPSSSHHNPEPSRSDESSKMTRQGNLRAYWLGAVLCIGGFLFGYDSGIIGGVLTLQSFERDYGYTKTSATRFTSLANSLQQLGAFLSCFLVWPVTRRFGRKWSLVASSIIFCIGALVQTINTGSFATFCVFRFISGLGLGSSSVVIPMFSSEMTPKTIRGQIGSFYQLFYTFGIFTSYWIDYGVKADIAATKSSQWQIPVGIQLVPGALLGLGVLTLPESTRWLTSKGRHEEAWKSLTWIRADSGPDTQLEMEEIRQGVEIEQHAREGLATKELVTNKSHFKLMVTAAAVFTAQQATGATAFAYYGPQYFALLVGNAGNRDLLLTAIFGAIKVAACLCFVLFVADRVNRKAILIAGATFMGATMISTAAVVKTHPAPTSADPHVTHSGIATVALIYMFVIAYNFSWGPLPCKSSFSRQCRHADPRFRAYRV